MIEGTGQAGNIRELALEILLETSEKKVYLKKALHNVLEQRRDLSKQDRAFLSRLTEGVMERKLEMDYIISLYSRMPLKKMRPVIRVILRMGIYQILYMNQIPVSAACNESVKLSVKRGLGSLRGFVNGVLRNVCRNNENITYPDREKSTVTYLSVRYSMPEWLVETWMEQLGEVVTESLLESFLNRKVTTLRLCTEKITPEKFKEHMDKAGIPNETGNYLPDAIRLLGYDIVEKIPGFHEGWFQVQDESSMMTAVCAGISEGQKILDVCAAPGGKALHAARLLNGTGTVYAFDLTEFKVGKIKENVKRMGYKNVEAKVQDALILQDRYIEKADIVMADLPCSGLGIIGKKSDIKYRVMPDDLVNLQKLQRNILRVVSQYVKPGGILMYSTCTIHTGENEENREWVTNHLPFKPESLDSYLPQSLHSDTTKEGYLQLIPGIHFCDGFFLSRFRRQLGGGGTI